MTQAAKTQIVKDFQKKSILVSREFNAPVALVWRAFTESEILDQWWGPAPWKAETKFQDFSVGGYWLYAMVSPGKETHWAKTNYLSIDAHKQFELEDVFCDENGVINPELPSSKGSNVFTVTAHGTLVEFKMNYPTERGLKQLIEMGFEQGITTCFEQLDGLISADKI